LARWLGAVDPTIPNLKHPETTKEVDSNTLEDDGSMVEHG
jgi:hypothetical protein